MRRSTYWLLMVLTLTLTNQYALGQGCSDAGFCTMGAMRPDQSYNKKIVPKLRSLEVNFYRGESLLTPVIYVATLDATVGLNDENYVQIKVPYNYAEGSLGALGGMGDLSISFTHAFGSIGNWTASGTLGGKIPMGDGNATVNNAFTEGQDAPLNMYYQPSLGSYDVVGGFAMINDKWLMATGIQIPLTRNNNQFVWANFSGFPDQDYVRKYNVGPELLRGIDVMLRVERNFRFTNFNFSLGLLPIYRITPDESLIPSEGVRGKRDGTTGMALSGLVSFGYQFDVKSGIKIIYGKKITDRDFNPDGLTRNNVWSTSYVYKF